MIVDPASAVVPAAHPQADKLREKAQELEAAFLAEMLKSAGLGKTPDSFGGGAGEDAFASFMVSEYADRMVQSGGIGLTESIVRALAEEAR